MPWVFDATPEVQQASNFPAIIGVSVSFTTLMLIVVVTRGVFRKSVLGWDDVAIFVTAFISVVYASMCVLQTRWGLGLPVSLRPNTTMYTFKVLSYAGKPWYPLTLAGYKLALCLGYLRFIEGTRMPGFRRVIIGVGTFCVVVQLVFVLINLFTCLPIRKSFDKSIPGRCLPFPPVQYPMAIISILCDVVVFLLPVPLFMRLSIHRAGVIGLCILFGCGLVTTVCSIARTCYLKDVGPTGNGDNTMVVLLGSVEGNVGIIMSCLPFLRALLANLIRSGGRTILGYGGTRSRPTKRTDPSYPLDEYVGTNKAYATGGTTKKATSETGSEDAIIYDEPDPLGGIVKTTQVVVQNEKAPSEVV